jgi:hypothetical protein
VSWALMLVKALVMVGLKTSLIYSIIAHIGALFTLIGSADPVIVNIIKVFNKLNIFLAYGTWSFKEDNFRVNGFGLVHGYIIVDKIGKNNSGQFGIIKV